MKLRDLKNLLDANRNKQFMLVLPNQNPVPASFHITEVGQINKKFIDCGGAIHSVQTCQLQAWIGDDKDHRLKAGKLADILKMARAVVPNDEIEVEIEYEDQMISQFPIVEHSVSDDAVTLRLATKHTDCLAKDKCLIPSSEPSSCCTSTKCC